MRTLKLEVAYDGTAYHGFQRQKNLVTIQAVLEDVLSKLCGERVSVAGSGRTDAGVHAIKQTVSLVTEGRIPCAGILRACDAMLPPDIRLLSAAEAPPGFHARFSARWKRYLYRIVENDCDSPFEARYAWQLRERPDLAKLRQAAAYLPGTHNFAAFRSSGSVQGSPVKTVYEARWQRSGRELLFTIAGNGFLYHMVRNLVWAMVQIGLGRHEPQALAAELACGHRTFLHAPAPPQGLYLQEVFYEDYAAPAENISNM